MGKSSEITDAYVRVELRNPGDFGSFFIGGSKRSEDDLNRDLDRLAEAIRRRVDKFEDDRGSVHAIVERQPICEHCGSRWTEESDVYNGGCCASDEENNPDEE